MSDVAPVGSFEYLKMQAIARLYLDNIPNIQSSWVTQGLKVGQLSLMYGANDMGSLMIDMKRKPFWPIRSGLSLVSRQVMG